MQRMIIWTIGFAFIASPGGLGWCAQPSLYTVEEVNSMFAAGVRMKIQRNGTKALVDQGMATGPVTRSLYDLETHQSYSWNAADPAPQCSVGKFSGDWGDPFAMSAEITQQIAGGHAKESGAEMVNGIPARIYEIPEGGNTARVWVEDKSGLVVKLAMLQNGQPKTILEVTGFSLSAAPASAFVLPPSCAAAASAAPPGAADRIAAETGADASNFASAILPPASAQSCDVQFRLVRAGAMTPITTGFQVALDREVDVNRPASYVMGRAPDGRATFFGGALRDVTSQMSNGTLRIANAPAQFQLETVFGSGGTSSALVYRQCYGPQTALLLVIKNPERIADGADLLWAKSGKFAASK